MTDEKAQQEINKFVIGRLKENVKNLLDDPHGGYNFRDPQDIVWFREDVDKLKRMLSYFNLKLETLMEVLGSKFEIERLTKLLEQYAPLKEEKDESL
jgi:hypothetical protein